MSLGKTEDAFAAGEELTFDLRVKAKVVPCDPRVFNGPGEGENEVFHLEISSNGGYSATHFVTEVEARAWHAEHAHL